MKKPTLILGLSAAVFVVACVVSYMLRSDLPGGMDGIRRVGFPLVIWEEGGFSHREIFSVVVLLADIAFAVVAGGLISMLYSARPWDR